MDLVARLRRCGCTGPAWHELAAALLEYGYTVLVVWGCTGTLGRHAARHGGRSARRVPVDLQLDEDAARALAGEVLLVSIERFRTRSLRRWDPSRGASLRTYFIGRCLMDLADVYAAWVEREVRPLPLEVGYVDDGRHGCRPDEQVEARELYDQVLDLDPDLCRALQLQVDGYSLTEIAKTLGTTPSGVRSQIYRRKRRLREEGLE